MATAARTLTDILTAPTAGLGQFLLAPAGADLRLPRSFRPRFECDGWEVHAGPSCPKLELPDGLILGEPLGECDGKEPVGGRWLRISAEDDRPVLSLDPFGSLACVYSESDGVVASSAALLEQACGRPTERPVTAFPADRPNQHVPFGETVFERTRRLLPGHELDLGVMTARRVRTPRPMFASVDDPLADGGIEAVAEALGRTLSAAAEHGRLLVPLTGGHDSRAIVAAMPPGLRRDALFYTFDFQTPARFNRVDLYNARRLAKRLRVEHVVVPIPEATDADKRQYQFDTGYSGGWGKDCDHRLGVGAALPPDGVLIVGFGRELARQSIPDRRDSNFADPDLDAVLRRIKMPPDRFCDEAAAWLAGVANFPGKTWLDLAYLESRIGAWPSAMIYGFAPFRRIVNPFNSRVVLDQFLSWSGHYQSQRRFAADVCRVACPELLRESFEDFTGVHKVAERLRNWWRRLMG